MIAFLTAIEIIVWLIPFSRLLLDHLLFVVPYRHLLFYLIPVACMIEEWRSLRLNARPERIAAYLLLLSSNAVTAFALSSGFELGMPSSEVVRIALIPLWLWPLVSWLPVTLLCFLGGHPSVTQGRFAPVVLAYLGSAEHFFWLLSV